MGIRNRNLQRGTTAWTLGASFWEYPIPLSKIEGGTAANVHDPYVNAQDLSGLVVGDDSGIPSFWSSYPFTLRFEGTFGGTTSAVTLDILGEDQFGRQVSETLDFTAGPNRSTTYCYRRFISAKVTGIAGTSPIDAGTTVSVGTLFAGGLRIPMLAANVPAAAIQAVVWQWVDPDGSQDHQQANFTVDTDDSVIIVQAPVPTVPDVTNYSGVVAAVVYLDPDLMGRF